MANFLGIAAAILTTVSFVPQAIKVFKTHDVSSISERMYILFVAGVACWTIFGFMTRDWQVFWANLITFVLAAAILYCKIRYTKHPDSK